MKFRRLGPKGKEIPVVIDSDGTCFDLSPLTADISGEFLQNNGPQRVTDLLHSGELKAVPDASAMRVGAPIARPQAVICIGQITTAVPPRCAP